MRTVTVPSNGRVTITREQRTYQPGGDRSHYRDLVVADLKDDPRSAAARESLLRHEHEEQVEARTTVASFATPPGWLVDRYASIPTPTRTLANAIDAAGGLVSLPQKPGFSSVNTPKWTTGTQGSLQDPGAPVPDTDIADAAVSSPVVVIAGQEDVPLQLLEQSGSGQTHLDAVIFKDIAADYDAKLEYQLINGHRWHWAVRAAARPAEHCGHERGHVHGGVSDCYGHVLIAGSGDRCDRQEPQASTGSVVADYGPVRVVGFE